MGRTLFDSFDRQEGRPKFESEPSFAFLNQTARPQFAAVRDLLESWFANYPEENRDDLRGRFCSKKEYNHQSAFFELFLHELLRRLGCMTVVHPSVPGASKRPDFLVVPPRGSDFHLEAAAVMKESNALAAGKAMVSQVVDALNEVESPDFFVDFDSRGRLDTAPPIRELKSKLSEWLKSLDHDDVSRSFGLHDSKALPRFTYKHENWVVECRPRPKGPKMRGKPGVRTLGMRSGGGGWSQSSRHIRQVLASKVSGYGDLQTPYVIAINIMDPAVDRDEIMEALFGSEQLRGILRGEAPVGTQMTRARGGLWVSAAGPTNTRVSAVLIGAPVLPWNIPRASLRLYHNPWTQRADESELSRLPRAVARNDQIEWVDGESLATVFELPVDWPNFD